jgi:hypothetical protein
MREEEGSVALDELTHLEISCRRKIYKVLSTNEIAVMLYAANQS